MEIIHYFFQSLNYGDIRFHVIFCVKGFDITTVLFKNTNLQDDISIKIIEPVYYPHKQILHC